MLDHIIVETGGMKMPLNRIAVVSVIDPKTLSVNPYDPQVLSRNRPISILRLLLASILFEIIPALVLYL